MRLLDKNIIKKEKYLRLCLLWYLIIILTSNKKKVNIKSIKLSKKIKTLGDQLQLDFSRISKKTDKDIIEFHNWISENKDKLGLNGNCIVANYYNSLHFKGDNDKNMSIFVGYDIKLVKKYELLYSDLSQFDCLVNNQNYDSELDSRIYNDTDYRLDTNYFNKRV